MRIEVSPELEQFIQAKVQSGRYRSASEVVGEALRLLEEQDRRAELRREELRQRIGEGLASLARGEGVNGEAVFERLEVELDGLEQRRKAG